MTTSRGTERGGASARKAGTTDMADDRGDVGTRGDAGTGGDIGQARETGEAHAASADGTGGQGDSPRQGRAQLGDEGAARGAGAKLVRGVRVTWTVSSLIVVESLVFGFAALPAIGFWTWVAELRSWGPPWVRTVTLSVSVAPAYIIFSMALMALTALACWALRWRTPPGEHSIRDLDPAVLKWVRYSATTHVVRVICGELFRATPIWRWYLKGMGAKIGKGVHINTAAIYDINLFTMEDHVVIGGRAQLSAHLVESGHVKAAPVTFRRACTVGTGSIVSPGVEVGEGGSIGALSFVTKYTKVPAHTAYGGVPAKFLKEFEDRPLSDDELLYREPGV